MVFEAIVVDILNRTLGNYVENLNKSQLKLGIWGGDVVLENLNLKENALEELQIPIKTIYGRLGKLVLKIPWKNLYNQSVEARIERLFLVVQPLAEIKYDAKREEALAFEAKQAELQRIEEAKRIADTSADKLNETFVEKLVTQIIKNVQIRIIDIHIRYEDASTNPKSPFALGVTLHNITIHTTDEKWVPTVVDETVTRVYKICELNGLAFYWNADAPLYSKQHPGEVGNYLQREIATKLSQPSHYDYILHPINAIARLKLNPNPNLDVPQFSLPKTKLSLQMDELTIALNNKQYMDIVLLADSMDRMARGAPYRKYRPDLDSYRGHYAEWWHFAYKCVLEEDVRRRRRNWDWNHMKQHRSLCKKYAEAYQSKLMNKNKITPEEKKVIELAEKVLDVLNLVIIRQTIELEVARLEKFESQQDDKKAGWFSSWWYGSSSKKHDSFDDNAHIIDKLEQAMTPEEKAKLYRAIDYQENSAPLHLPIEYVATKCIFHLDKLQLHLTSSDQRILHASLDHVDLQMLQRPSANALTVVVGIRSFTVWGSQQGKFLPRLVVSKGTNEVDDLLSIAFETNPLDARCDQRVKMAARPLEIVYDAQTVIDLVAMFKPPHESSALASLQAAAEIKMTEFKEKSALGMQYAVEHHTFVDIDCNIDASYIVIPKLGKFVRQTESCIVIKLGAISIKSEPRDEHLDVARLHREGYNEEAILKEIVTHSYDKMMICITDMQVVIAYEQEDWLTTINSNTSTPMHLLEPTTLVFQFHKCVIVNDPRLPKMKVFGELEKISITIAEERLLLVFEIIVCMPLPQSAEPEPLKPGGVAKYSSSVILKYLDPAEKQKRDEINARKKSDRTVQLTEVEAFFIMKEFVLCVNRRIYASPSKKAQEIRNKSQQSGFSSQTTGFSSQSTGFASDTSGFSSQTVGFSSQEVSMPNDKFMVFCLKLLEITFTQRTFNMEASCKLGSVNLQHYRPSQNIIQVIRTQEFIPNENLEPRNSYSNQNTEPQNSQSSENIEPPNPYLFVIKYVNVNKLCPDFRSVYGSVEQLILFNFTNVTLLLHLESMQEMLVIINDYQTRLAVMSNGADRVASAGTLPTIVELEQLPSTSSSKETQITLPKSIRSKPVESIQLKMAVDLGAIEIVFATDLRPLSSVQLRGAKFGLIMKSSYMQVNTTITSIQVDDLNPETIHKEILKVLGGDVFKINVVIYDKIMYPHAEVNMAIQGSINCLRIVYLNWFVSSMMDFLNNFQAAQEAIIEASAQAADAARANVQNVYDTAQKISLKFHLAAPLIIVPENSKSLNVVLIDLGKIVMRNKFTDITIAKNETKATVDELTLNLDNLKISCTHLHPKTHLSVTSREHLLLKPTNFSLLVKRSLSPWCHQLPDLEILGSFKSIYMILRQDDYKSLLKITHENLNEGQDKVTEVKSDTDLRKKAQPVPKERMQSLTKSVQGLTESEKLEKDEPKTTIKFAFSMESFVIDLAMNCNPGSSEYLINSELARFALAVMSVKGSMLSDDSMCMSFVLVDCIIDDLRPSRRNKISRYLERRSTNSQTFLKASSSNFVSKENMIDLTYTTKVSDTFVDLKISSFELILAMDFLNKVSEFITKGFAEPTPEELKKDTIKYAESKIDRQKVIIEEKTSAVMTVNIKIEKPDIILVESMEQRKCEALVLHMEARLKIRKTEDTMAVNGGISDIQLQVREVNCEIDTDDLEDHLSDSSSSLELGLEHKLSHAKLLMPAHAHKEEAPLITNETLIVPEGRARQARISDVIESRYILAPTSLSLTYSQPDDQGVHLDLTITNINITISPDVITLLNRVLATMTKAEEDVTIRENKAKFYDPGMWNIIRFDPNKCWFVKAEEAEEAVEQEIEEKNLQGPQNEICIISCQSIEIAFEVEIGTEFLPVVSMQASLTGQAKDWSTNMHLESVIKMEVSYYNLQRAAWEPIVEPVEVLKHGEFVHIPWELKIEVSIKSSEAVRSIDTKDEAENLKWIAKRVPQTTVTISSTETMEITMTNSGIEVLTQLSNSLSEAMEVKDIEVQRSVNKSLQKIYNDPFVLHNCLGFNIMMKISENQDFSVAAALTSEGIYNEILLKPGASIGLQLKHGAFSVLRLNETPPELSLNLRVAETGQYFSLPVERVSKRYFPLWPHTVLTDTPGAVAMDEIYGFISDVVMRDLAMQIYLRSLVQVSNSMSMPVNVYYMTANGLEVERIGCVAPGGVLRLPLYAIHTRTAELFFSVDGFSVTVSPFIWRELENEVSVSKLLECDSKDRESEEKFYIQVLGKMEQVYYEHSNRYTLASCCYNIILKPAVKLQNCLPVKIGVSQMGIFRKHDFQPGEMFHLSYIKPYKANIVIVIENYMEKCWSCTNFLPDEDKELSVYTFNSHDSPVVMTLYLGIHNVNDDGTQLLSLYCPFWMINKTSMTLCYRSVEEAVSNVTFHPKDSKEPVLFSFNPKNFFAKKKASIRVEFSDWSEEFSLDIPGSSGIATCKMDNKILYITVTNQLTFNSLTKMVIFTPFFMILNEAPFDIEYAECIDVTSERKWTLVKAESVAPLWPHQDNRSLILRVAGTSEDTAPFYFREQRGFCLKLSNVYAGLSVQVQLNGNGIHLVVRQYCPGDAPAFFVNYTDHAITLQEKNNINLKILPPMHQMYFTWENPTGSRLLVFRGHTEKANEVTDLLRDCIGEFLIAPNRKVTWVSFLDGLQRTVLFTDDPILASGARTIGDAEIVNTEIILSIQGVGLSLVNDIKRQEIIYMSMCSSGVMWEQCKIGSRRYKKVSNNLADKLENAYQRYMDQKAINDPLCAPIVNIDEKTKVNLDEMRMLQPHARLLKRTLEAGLWIALGITQHTHRFHARLHRLQVDQQLPLPVYPVVFAPVRPPRSVALMSNTLKPFVEMSIVERVMERTKVKQYQYYRVLIQEFQVKVDMRLVNALLTMFPQRFLTEQEALERFKLDLKDVSRPLDKLILLEPNSQKNFYDNLHLSPLKVHVSFYLGSETSLPTFIGTILQSIGVTLTNMNDVVLKLSYYERNYEYLSQEELYNSVLDHYKAQALKQLYVLVLGLDVIGNPYGLVVGIKKGVGDLFYEPFSGAIQGPGEFAEGLFLGVRSLVGHTVGGAADAVSRITGAMGHGLAALSLDKEYQQRRRDNLNKPATNLGEGLARSGKGLVMGVYDGVTGVFTKPLEGAREEGVGGFFKGVGYGAAGLVARPASGVADFATGSFDAFRRAADWSQDTVKQRQARYLPPDSCVKPYSRQLAEGFKLLSEVEKGKYLKTDAYKLHIWSVPQKVAVICTDKRVLYIEHTPVFGGWHVAWCYQWSEIKGKPKISNTYVCIYPIQNQMFAMFRGEPSPKKVYLETDKQRKQLVETCAKLIEKHRG